MKLAHWLILLGSIVLFASGLVHLLGYPHIFPVLVSAGVDLRLIGAIKTLWLSFTVEFVILSPAFVWISRLPRGRNLLLFLTLIPLMNAFLMYYLIGPFIGAHMVLAGALLLLLGAWLLPSDAVLAK
jgi:hypothetical protein